MKDRKDEIKEKEKETENKAKEISLDELDDVSGAGDPFAEEPRVPGQPIDPNVRPDL